MERAHAHDLQYLADAELVGMLASNLPKETHQTLLQVAPDILRMEQYMDFLRNRTFRMTLLAHAAQPINRNLSGEQLSGLHLSAALSGQERTPDGGVSFRSLSGAVLTSSSPDFIRALAKLVEASPRTMSVDELVIAVPLDSQVLNAGTQRRETLALDLMQCVFGGFVRLHGHPISCTGIVSDRPRASRLAREQARLSSMATSQRHQTQPLNDLSRQVVQRLDGTKTHDDLIQDLISLTHAGELAVADSGTPIEEPRALREALVLALNTTLEQLAEQALLIS